MSDNYEETWKADYLAKGLPEGLLDEMIAEANAEYESELQYSPYDRYAPLGVLVLDIELGTGEFYLYVIQRASEVFQGRAGLLKTELFAQIPTVEIVAEVYVLHWNGVTGLTVRGFGYQIFNHTKEEEVTVNVARFGEFELIPFSYVMFNIDDGYTPTGEDMQTSDSGLQEETAQRTETVNIINT